MRQHITGKLISLTFPNSPDFFLANVKFPDFSWLPGGWPPWTGGRRGHFAPKQEKRNSETTHLERRNGSLDHVGVLGMIRRLLRLGRATRTFLRRLRRGCRWSCCCIRHLGKCWDAFETKKCAKKTVKSPAELKHRARTTVMMALRRRAVIKRTRGRHWGNPVKPTQQPSMASILCLLVCFSSLIPSHLLHPLRNEFLQNWLSNVEECFLHKLVELSQFVRRDFSFYIRRNEADALCFR